MTQAPVLTSLELLGFGVFFPLLTWWKQAVPSKPREGRVTREQPNLGALSCTRRASPPLFHPPAPPLSPQKLQETAKSVPRGKGFCKDERRS